MMRKALEFPHLLQGTWVPPASMLLASILRSVHAFSIFLEPMENYFQTSRSQVSLTYFFTILSLTVGVLSGQHFYGLLRPASFSIAVCGLTLVGTLIAASATHICMVWLRGYWVCLLGNYLDIPCCYCNSFWCS